MASSGPANGIEAAQKEEEEESERAIDGELGNLSKSFSEINAMIKRRRVARAFKSIAIFYFILSTTSCQEAEEDVRPLEQAELEATVRRLASKQLEEPLLSAGARQQPVQQAANGASHATRLAAGAVANISQVLLDRFHYLFDQLANDSAQAFQEQQAGQQQQQQQHNQQQHQHQLDKLTELFVIKSGGEAAEGSRPSGNGGEPSQLQSSLETRATFGGHYGAPQAYDQLQESNKRNFVRILNRVFSRIELPDSFRRSAGSTSSANLPSGPPSVSSSIGVQVGSPVIGTGSQGHCGSHIGCIAELPNFPMILKLKPNVSASFTIYTRERGYKSGQRILFEPLMHYQLQDGDKLSDLELQREVVNITRQLKIEKLLPQIMPHYKAHMGAKRHYSYANHHLGRQDSLRKRLQTTAASWISSGNRIVTSKEFPFDLSALEQSGFNASLTTRIIIGGYFAKEDEEWIDEIIRQWLLLEPSNVIKVSWQDSNRGLYHSAAYNSRIVGRQLSLFLHYLNELFHIDLNRFHLVGHSLGAHIAGFVGADNEGQIARITGLDPAGPIFVDLHQIHRLDSSDAKFVDVVHTNGGTITKGALGLSTPSGHVDYYCNGGSLQPGCFFSSVTMSIMDPVERIACNHRRSYRYFTEIIKLAVRHQRPAGADEQLGDLSYRSAGSAEFELASGIEAGAPHSPLTSEVDESKFPQAFLFEAKQEDLVKLVQPDVKLIRHGHQERAGEWQLAPTRKLIEFHSLNPDFPRDKHGLYYFRTRTEAPFFGKFCRLRRSRDEDLALSPDEGAARLTRHPRSFSARFQAICASFWRRAASQA